MNGGILLAGGSNIQAFKSALVQHIATTRSAATDRELADLYATSVTVYAAANKRAAAVAAVPLKVVDAEGEDVPLSEPLARLFHRGVREIMRRTELTIFFWGRNLLHKGRNLYGSTMRLRWLNPNLWVPETDTTQGLRGFRVYRGGSNYQALHSGLIAPRNAVFMHTVDFADDFDGVAPAEVAFLEAGLSVEMAQTGVSFFRNRAIPPLIIQPAKETQLAAGGAAEPKEKDVNTLVSFLRRFVQGSRNSGRTVVQPTRWETISLQQNFDELAMPELKEETRKAIAMAAEVPLALLMSDASNYAELYDTRRGWYEGWVRPQCEWYAELFTEQLVAEVNDAWRVEPDFSRVAAMKESAAALTDVVNAQLAGGYLDLYQAQQRLGIEPDDVFRDMYLFDGVPVPKEVLPRLWMMRFGTSEPEENGETAQPPGSPSIENESSGESRRLPPTPPAPERGVPAANSGNVSTVVPIDQPKNDNDAEPPGDEKAAVQQSWLPDPVFKELRDWSHIVARKGADYEFAEQAIPQDTAAYLRFLMIPGSAGTIDLVEAGRIHYLNHHRAQTPEAAKGYAETAIRYRATLYDLLRAAFRLGEDGLPTFSRQQFGQAGREEITVAFQAAFMDGLRAAGVYTDKLDEDEARDLKLEIKAERSYWTALANRLYRKTLPLYRIALALRVTAQYAPTDEERKALLQQADEKLAAFNAARDEFLRRIDLWVNKGLRRIFDLGKLAAKVNPMLKWKLGATKEHCRSCWGAAGQVHRKKTWQRYGLLPRTDVLECGGFKCGCDFEETAERARGRIDRIPMIAAQKGLDASDPPGYSPMVATNFGFAVSFANDPALQELAGSLQAQVPGDGVEWLSPYEWHLSLVYAAQPQPMNMVMGFSDGFPITDADPVPLKITGLEVWDVLDDQDQPTKALVAIVEPVPELLSIQEQLYEQFSARDLEVLSYSSPDKYRPHITLAYGDNLSYPPALEGEVSLLLDNICLTTPELTLLFWHIHDGDEYEPEPEQTEQQQEVAVEMAVTSGYHQETA